MPDARQFIAAARTMGFFQRGELVILARAPGRLDVMGGIADYSGALVLQLPIAEATCAAVQKTGDGTWRVASLAADGGNAPREIALSRGDFVELLGGDYPQARQWFRRDPATAWAAYVLGAVLVLVRQRAVRLDGGLRILVRSDVPEGKGVSSSAALEVATMQAVARLLDVTLGGEQLASLCQLAENRVVGAPCGIMDQMTSALGRADHLLALLCQPASVQGFVPLPADIRLWGIDSGIRHAVSGSDYTSVRTGAFMGYRILADLAGLAATDGDTPGVVRVTDPRWQGYLANVTPAEWEADFAARLPASMSGREFLDRYGGTTDAVTRVAADGEYAVRQPAAHRIYEHARVRRFAELLAG